MESTSTQANDILDPSQLLEVLNAFKRGEFEHRMPVDQTGVAGKIADTVNDLLDLNQRYQSKSGHVAIGTTQMQG